MKFLSWFGGKQDNKKSNTCTTTYHRKQDPREEFSDWPHSILAIGTFGNSNNEIKENPSEKHNNNYDNKEEDPSSSSTEEIADFTPEEIGKLQKELTKLLRKKPTNVEKEIAELPLDRFLNCPSSLEVDRRISNALCNDDSAEDKEENIEKTLSVILGKCKEICADNKKKAVGKKSISFLLKKMFVCRSGFAPAPTLRDTLQESRMEKVASTIEPVNLSEYQVTDLGWSKQELNLVARLLRTILHKKLHSQQSSSRSSSMKKCLEDRKNMPKKKDEDELEEQVDDGCKWVKTDSEYIVLEI